MKIKALLLSFLLSACALFSGVRTEQGVDLGVLAQKVALVRQDVTDLAALSDPATQAKILGLTVEIKKVEDALTAAAAGGPISDVNTAANAAFSVATVVIEELRASGKDVGNLPLYVALGRIAFRHLAIGEIKKADEVLDEGPVQ